MSAPPAPAKWLPETRKFYRHVTGIWDLSQEDQDILLATCGRLNQYYRCEKILDDEGLVVGGDGEGLIRQHPAAAIQKQAWGGFLQGLKLLDLNEAVNKANVGRPAGVF